MRLSPLMSESLKLRKKPSTVALQTCRLNGHAKPASTPPECSRKANAKETAATVFKILLGSIFLAFVTWLYYTSGGAKTTTLPESYVLCSHHGSAIYTVDDDDSKVDCLAVHGSRILHTGTLGAQNLPS